MLEDLRDESKIWPGRYYGVREMVTSFMPTKVSVDYALPLSPTPTFLHQFRSPRAIFTIAGHERVGFEVQTFTTPELIFRAYLANDGSPRLELART
jgi:hypothetical protein